MDKLGSKPSKYLGIPPNIPYTNNLSSLLYPGKNALLSR